MSLQGAIDTAIVGNVVTAKLERRDHWGASELRALPDLQLEQGAKRQTRLNMVERSQRVTLLSAVPSHYSIAPAITKVEWHGT